MIAKAKSISHTAASVDYARKLKEADEKKGIVLDQNMVAGKTGAEVFKEFKIFQNLNARCQRNTIGIVLSPNKEDNLSNEQFVNISREVIKRMGLQDHQYITFKHNHETHDHLHLYVNRIDTNGQAFKDNHISKKIQTIADEVALDYNMTRAKEVETTQQLIKEPIREKIRLKFEDVLNSPETTTDNVFKKLEQKDIKIKFNNADTNKATGFSVELDGVKFKASEIDKNFSLPKLKINVNNSFAKNNKQRIKEIFNSLLSEKETRPDNFLQKIADRGIGVIPSINNKGETQGYRVNLNGEDFKASEIGNQFTLKKLPATIHEFQMNYRENPSSNKFLKPIADKELVYKIISEVIVDNNTTSRNFYNKLEEKGFITTPLLNSKNEICNFNIKFNHQEYLATDLLLKHALQNPDYLINETRKIQNNKIPNIRNEVKSEIIEAYKEALHSNLPNQKSFFTQLKNEGLEFSNIDHSDYKIEFKNQQFLASELNPNYKLDQIDNLMKLYQQDNHMESTINRVEPHNDFTPTNENTSYSNDSINDAGEQESGLFENIIIPHIPKSSNYDDDEESEYKKKKRKRNNNELTR